jgi:hypothetical protein
MVEDSGAVNGFGMFVVYGCVGAVTGHAGGHARIGSEGGKLTW